MIKFWERSDGYNDKFLQLVRSYDPHQKHFEIGVFDDTTSESDVDKSKNNVYVVSALNAQTNPNSVLDEYYFELELENIAKAKNFGFQIYIDFSWELYPPKYFQSSKLQLEWHEALFEVAKAKIICPNNFVLEQKQHFEDQGVRDYTRTSEKSLEQYLNIVKPFELFSFNTRYTNTFHNKSYHLNTYPVPAKEKKYFMSFFIGDIYKFANVYALHCFMEKSSIKDNSIYSALLGKHLPNIKKYENELHEIEHRLSEGKYEEYSGLEENIKNFFNNQSDLLKNALFERYEDMNYTYNWNGDIPHQHQERRMPQIANESHLYMSNETTSLIGDIFYTEKTWKPLMAGLPFIINGPPLSNTLMKNQGYEIFEEIIDYSFDNNLKYYKDVNHSNDDVILYQKNLFDEMERLYKEGPSVFSQPIVKEKVEYNKHMFYKNTTTENFVKTINEYFGVE